MIATPEDDGWEHEHVHNWDGGERRVRHSHPRPRGPEDVNAIRPHRHKNGRHSHAHPHDIYPRAGETF